MRENRIEDARVYVGTYKKYNNGNLAGAWLELAGYSSPAEFWDACKELHKDEREPEYMFQDWENIPEGLISESFLDDEIFEVIESLNDFDGDKQDAFFQYCKDENPFFRGTDADTVLSDFENKYIGQYDSEIDFAEMIIDEMTGISDFCRMYFDTEKYARDLFIDSYFFSNGFVFSRR